MDAAKKLEAISQANTLYASNVDELDLDALKDVMSEHTFACIRGLVSPQEVATAKAALRENFNPQLDHPSHGEPKGAAKKNFQKLAVGGAMQCGVYRPRFFRTIYNPLWEPNVYQMHDIFERMCQVRNKILDKPIDYAIDTIEDGLWTAARIHQYPPGGGFLVAHRDTVLTKVAQEAGMEYCQLFLMMTKIGQDFEQGGGFVEIDGERFIFEEYYEIGDILIYDGRTTHGVLDIDPHKLPNVTELAGRLVAFVTWYKDLESSS